MRDIYGTNLDGARVARSVVRKGSWLSELFALDFSPERRPDTWLAWHGTGAELVDFRPAFEEIRPGATLLYRNVIPHEHSAEFMAYFAAQVTADVVRDSVEVDVDTSLPLDRAEFWRVISSLGGAASARAIQKLRKTLARKTPEFIVSFGVRLVIEADQIDNETALKAVQSSAIAGGDSLLWARMAILARGLGAVDDGVPRRAAIVLNEEEWEAGEGLIDVAADAYELRTGYPAVFLSGEPSAFQVPKPQQVEYTGERSAQTMLDAGLAPTIVGSRFLVDRESVYVDCVAVQLIDVEREHASRVLTQLAEGMSEVVGGRLASAPLMDDQHTPGFSDGQTVFQSKQKQIVDLGLYRKINGLTLSDK